MCSVLYFAENVMDLATDKRWRGNLWALLPQLTRNGSKHGPTSVRKYAAIFVKVENQMLRSDDGCGPEGNIFLEHHLWLKTGKNVRISSCASCYSFVFRIRK